MNDESWLHARVMMRHALSIKIVEVFHDGYASIINLLIIIILCSYCYHGSLRHVIHDVPDATIGLADHVLSTVINVG